MEKTKAPDKTISQILDELEDEGLRVYAWRLYCLERAEFDMASAVLVARSNADLHQAIRLKEQGCDPQLVALIVA